MSFFNLFRRNKSAESLQTPPVLPSNNVDSLRAVDRNLFVDDEQPELENPIKKIVNHIECFLDRNFEWLGYNDGYGHPEIEYLQNKLKVMRAEFCLAVDKCLDARRSEVGELKMHLIQTSGISARMEAQLSEKIKQVEVIVHELDTQKILSGEDQGIVASVVHAYRLGFIKGVEQYQQEKLFGGTTGLFNQ